MLLSGALTLLTNAVIAYNTWKWHQVLERRREAGQPVPSDEILAHIAPIVFRHISFQGIYRLPLERYLDRLLPSALPQKITAGAKWLIDRKPLLLAGFGKHPLFVGGNRGFEDSYGDDFMVPALNNL